MQKFKNMNPAKELPNSIGRNSTEQNLTRNKNKYRKVLH